MDDGTGRWRTQKGDSPGPERELEPPPVPAEAHRLWAASLKDLQLQMTRATLDTWLRGSRVVEATGSCLTIAVRYAFAVDWL